MKTNETFVIVPQSWLEEFEKTQHQILTILKEKNDNASLVGDFVTEEEAKRLLKKETTWFWNMRKSGRLPFTKLGRTNYYSRADIIKLLEEGKANH